MKACKDDPVKMFKVAVELDQATSQGPYTLICVIELDSISLVPPLRLPWIRVVSLPTAMTPVIQS
jgi:hypothetical protein